jgi:CRP-like cAMP-binding protein
MQTNAPGHAAQGHTGNRILDALPSPARRGFQGALVEVHAGKQLTRQGDAIRQVFFPTTAVCSVVVELASGDKAETATVGSDGFVGVSLVLGSPVSEATKTVQVTGQGYLLSARKVLELCRQHAPFYKALLGYTAFRLHVASRSVACNSFHSIEQRLARWLLFTRDRAGKDELVLTHEELAALLATTRPRVTQVAARLRAAGMIEYRRGKVRILDGQRLKSVSCECYAETKKFLATLPTGFNR